MSLSDFINDSVNPLRFTKTCKKCFADLIWDAGRLVCEDCESELNQYELHQPFSDIVEFKTDRRHIKLKAGMYEG